jgi:hypothetical protein
MLALWTALWLSALGCNFDESKLRRPAKEASVEQQDRAPDVEQRDVQGGRPESGGGPDLIPEAADLVEARPDVGASDIARDAATLDEDGGTVSEVPAAKEDLVRLGSTDSGEVSADGGQNADGGDAPASDDQSGDVGGDMAVDHSEDADAVTVMVPSDAAESAHRGPTLDTGTADAGLSNLALAGAAYRWSANSSSTANANRVAEPKLNDDSTADDVNLAGNGWDPVNDAWEAAGVLLARAATVTSVVYVNGSFSKQSIGGTTYSGDGNFDANFHLQLSTDGTVWTDATGWSVTPSYPYDGSASNGSYIFSGKATGAVGVRVTGQVRLGGSLDVSWNATTREVQVWGPD